MSLVSVEDYEQKAKTILPKMVFDYYKNGAFKQVTTEENLMAYRRIAIKPRVLRNVSNRSTKTDVFGIPIDMPIGISPTAYHKMAHPDGEIGTAIAAGQHNIIYTMCFVSTTKIEEVAAAAPDTHKWLQIYFLKNRQLTTNAVRKAEECGFKAIVISSDLPLTGIRWNDSRNKLQIPSHLSMPNFGEKGSKIGSSRGELDDSASWEDVKWLVNFTKLPVIIKGICYPEDAILAADAGCKGIIVSNHGGRHLDGLIPTIEALPGIVKAVGNRMIVMIDSGVTDGTDVFKALALGAKMVLIGRPILWGLAVNGQKGVEDVLSIYKHELNVTMALSGTRAISEINRDFILTKEEKSKL